MSKSQLIDAITTAGNGSISAAAADRALEAVLSTITSSLRAGKKFTIVGFGSFEPVQRSARVGRNPRTGETIPIEASTGVRFSAGKGRKEALN